MFLSQEDSVAVVASLPENLDGDFNIKVYFIFTALFKYSVGRQHIYDVPTIIDSCQSGF